jgi:succinate dehydrogenase/fumarate reductase cytochrome b subunit
VFIGAVMVGLFFVVFHIISVTMHEMKENDKSVGEALKLGMNGMVKFIILIVVAAIAIPLV